MITLIIPSLTAMKFWSYTLIVYLAVVVGGSSSPQPVLHQRAHSPCFNQDPAEYYQRMDPILAEWANVAYEADGEDLAHLSTSVRELEDIQRQFMSTPVEYCFQTQRQLVLDQMSDQVQSYRAALTHLPDFIIVRQHIIPPGPRATW